jgi:acetolactate synthase-1/2/3 large subunit
VMLTEPQGPAYMAVPRESAMHPIQEAQFPLLDQLPPAPAALADRQLLRQAAQWLLDAESPLICTSRTGRDNASVQALVELAETIGARVMADFYRMSFPGSHPLQRGSTGVSPTPPETDCILGLDLVVPWMPENFTAGSNVKVIRIAGDPIERGTMIYEFPTDLSISGSAGKAIPALLEEVRSLMSPEQKRRAEARVERYREEGRKRIAGLLDTAESARAKGIIHPLWLSHQIGQLDPETLITHELCENTLFNRTLPQTLFGPGGSSIGFAAPMAIGVKTAAPDRQVVAAVGDGSWMFSNPQVCTWASKFHNAPVLFVIFNNRGYRTGTHEVLRAYPEGYAAKARDLTGGWFDPCPDYSGEARGGGYFGEKVTDPNDLAAALKRGLDATRQGVPAVLDVWMPKHITGEV